MWIMIIEDIQITFFSSWMGICLCTPLTSQWSARLSSSALAFSSGNFQEWHRCVSCRLPLRRCISSKERSSGSALLCRDCWGLSNRVFLSKEWVSCRWHLPTLLTLFLEVLWCRSWQFRGCRGWSWTAFDRCCWWSECDPSPWRLLLWCTPWHWFAERWVCTLFHPQSLWDCLPF